MVTWFLNGTRVLQQDPGSEVNERSSQNGPYNVTTSTLMISSAQQKLNVEVQCLARSTNAEIDLPDANATAELVVLGKLFVKFVSCLHAKTDAIHVHGGKTLLYTMRSSEVHVHFILHLKSFYGQKDRSLMPLEYVYRQFPLSIPQA